MIKLLVFLNGDVLISKIEEVSSELGEPDCKLTDPYIVNKDKTLVPWLLDLSTQSVFMIHSDKILTISTPKESLIMKYEELVK